MARHVKPGNHAAGSAADSPTTEHSHDEHNEHHGQDHHDHHEPVAAVGPDHDAAHEKFGGMNLGAAFFGWLVAIGVTILLSSIIGAIVAGIGSNTSITQTEAERQAGTIGIVAAIVLLTVLAIGYYAGGYVAGRMSRFDGGRQGLGVWVIGLLVTIVAVVVGALAGDQYNILDRVALPRIPLPSDQVGWGGLITAAAVLVVTLLAAMAGGKVGRHYHTRVDRAAAR